jgi:hypothetical protein
MNSHQHQRRKASEPGPGQGAQPTTPSSSSPENASILYRLSEVPQAEPDVDRGVSYSNEGYPEPETPLDAALTYGAMGWSVVPMNYPVESRSGVVGCSCYRGAACRSIGKHPWVRWKQTGGCTNAAVISSWWDWHPVSGVGICTGARSDFWVLDIDPDHNGNETIAQLEHRYGPLPETLRARTGGGGWHLVFKYPPGGARQTAGKIGPGVDTRSDGGLIVAAPSQHRSGWLYTWENWGVPLAPTPTWLLNLVEPAPVRPRRPVTPRGGARGAIGTEAALTRSVAELRALKGSEGTRNDSLNRSAFILGRRVGDGLITATRVAKELYDVATEIGLDMDEAEATIMSGLRAGIATTLEPPHGL